MALAVDEAAAVTGLLVDWREGLAALELAVWVCVEVDQLYLLPASSLLHQISVPFSLRPVLQPRSLLRIAFLVSDEAHSVADVWDSLLASYRMACGR